MAGVKGLTVIQGRIPESPLFEQVVAHFADDLPDLERLLFDELCAFESLGAELFKLHQLCVRKHHSDAIIQIVHPPSDPIFIHGSLIYHVDYCLRFIVSCMI